MDDSYRRRSSRGNLNIVVNDDDDEDDGHRPPSFHRGRRGQGFGRGRNFRGRPRGRGRGGTMDARHEPRDASEPRFKLAIHGAGEEENDGHTDEYEREDTSHERNSERGRERRIGRGNQNRGGRGAWKRHSSEHRRPSHGEEHRRNSTEAGLVPDNVPHRGSGSGRPRGRGGQQRRAMRRGVSMENISGRSHTDRTRVFGYRRLSELDSPDKSPDVLVMELNTSRNGFQELLKDDDLSTKPDWMMMILSILSRAFKSTQRQSVMELLTLIVEVKFIQVGLTPFLSEILNSRFSVSTADLCNFLDNVCILVSELLKRTQFNMSAIALLITVMDTLMTQQHSLILQQQPDILEKVEELKKMRDAVEEQREEMNYNRNKENIEKKRRDMENSQPPEDFRSLPILPSLKDLQFFEKPFLRANKVNEGYENLDHYLDVQFRLLREDYVRPLRTGIAEYRRQRSQGVLARKFQDIRLYEKVQIIKPMCTHRGILHMIQFDVSKMKGVRWESSRRLLYGSLVCLSSDDFETILFATVTNRDTKDLSQGLIQVQFEQNIGTSAKERYVMAETTAYFEAYRHILEGLQEIPRDLPLQKYIVKCDTTLKPPKYLLKGVLEFDFGPLMGDKEERLVPVINPRFWPMATELNLDDSQHKALQMAITKEFAIIQGPPGTGKTYVGWKIVQLLLHNKQRWTEGETDPILVVCYTNHALDQFLSEISHFTEKIIRVGGRCQSDNLEPYMLKNYRRRARENKDISRTVHERKSDCLRKMAHFREQIETVSAKLQAARTGILKTDKLEKFITPEQKKSLSSGFLGTKISKDEQMLTWLGLFTDTPEEEVEKNKPTDIYSQWRDELMEGDRIDAMTEAEVQGVDDVWKLKLPDRAALYKYWIKTYQRILGQTIDKNTELYQSLVQNKMAYKEQDLIGLRNRIQDMENKLHQSRFGILKEKVLYTCLPHHAQNLIHSLVQSCPKPSPTGACIEIWLCLDDNRQNKDILSDALKELDDDLVDVEEEATAEDAERRLNDDDDDEEIELMARHSKRTKVQMVHDALSEMSFSTLESGQERLAEDGQWHKVPMSKSKLSLQMRRLLNINNPMQEDEAARRSDVWILRKQDRMRLYRFWMDSYMEELRSSIENSENEFENLCKSYREAMDAEDAELMIGAEVIGMTTTGAAKYRTILQKIEPKIIVVEEAAEVLESHIVTTINSNCQHLILIGDHKQLRPTPTVYDLAMKYNLEISLFERMVQNRLNYTTLRLQHRMRPEISILMKHIYSDLEDHEAVLKYPHVRGVSKDVFMINHSAPEMSHDETKSKSNLHEARFLAHLCRYLLQQGYSPSQITVLATYTGQVLAIRKCMPKRDFEGVRITAVDNFQGEENDIILLSLVRSNSDDSIGFLKIENRICVALSRARMGFYIIGNFTLLTKVSTLWEDMVHSMAHQNCFGTCLTLRCQNHPEQETKVEKAEDFTAIPNGGCKLMCNTRLPCGHVCEQFCHPEDREHKHYRCLKPCARVVCDLGHTCVKKCYDECGKCLTKVTKTLPLCGHQHMMHCHKEPSTFTCISPCSKKLDCGHTCQGSCGVCTKNGVHNTCKEKCSRLLPCGHNVEAECSLPVERIECEVDCNTKLTCGHDCVGTCHTCSRGKLHIPCQKKCGRPLICGHNCNQTCSEPCPPCKKKCVLRCDHSVCRNKCGEACIKCEEPCKWACEHQECTLKCHEICNRPPCFMQCSKTLPCDCPCIGFCGEICPDLCLKCRGKEFNEVTNHVSNKTNIRLVVLEDCKHIFEASFLDDFMSTEGTVESTSAPVERKRCPKCSVLVLRSRRYTSNLKLISNNVDIVKERLDGDRRLNNRRKTQALKEIDMLRHINEFAADNLLKKPDIKEKERAMSARSLDLLENQIEIIKCIHEVSSSLQTHLVQMQQLQGEIKQSLEHLNNWVLREYFLPSKKDPLKTRWRLSFTQQELEEVKQEISRISYIVKFSAVSREAGPLSESLTSCVQAVQKLLTRKLTDVHEDKISRVWKIVCDSLQHFNPPKFSTPKLIESKGMIENGQWYRCRKGHLNQVQGEKQKCRECHLQVGPDCYRPRVTYPPTPVDIPLLEVNDPTGDAAPSLHPMHDERTAKQVLEELEKGLAPAGADQDGTSAQLSHTRGIDTLQPGKIKSNSTGRNNNLEMNPDTDSPSGKRYLFKCSNGHHHVYRISDLPHKCSDCESTLFTQQREVEAKTSKDKVDDNGSPTKGAGHLTVKQEKFKMVVKCKQEPLKGF